MTAVFVETTVLTDYLLKRDGSERAAATAFQNFNQQIVPQFAWKEFKRGPLKNFVWAHNKLVDTQSFLETLAALQRMSRSPHRYLTSTAIQAFHTAFATLFDKHTLDDLRVRYGGKANLDSVHADVVRLELKRAIIRSWNWRMTLFGGPHHILACYPDAPIKEAGARLEVKPYECHGQYECCLKAALAGRGKDLSTARRALKKDAKRKEITQRIKVLRQLEKHFTSLMGIKDCRAFGDAYFVLFCPAKAVVLTTNTRDIEPMATALGIKSARP
jgi:hypothetical protein